MPLYAIIADDRADAGTLRADTRSRHLEYLATLGARLDRAGPMLDEDERPIGSIVIANFADLAAAERFAEGDPYARAGLFATVRTVRWRRVLP